MESWELLPAPEESPQVARLRTRSAELLACVARLADEPGSGVRRLVGLRAMVVQLRRIAPAATSSAYVMQPQYSYDPEEPGVALARDARRRGVETKLITRPATMHGHPLLSSIYPATLLGPAFVRALVIDGRQAIIGGPDDLTGHRTSWYTTSPDVAQAVIDLWHETSLLCTPILREGELPPLTERQLEVARLLCLGADDDVIAQHLRLDACAVQGEVRAVLGALGAGSRGEAVLMMCGRGVNGGWRSAYM